MNEMKIKVESVKREYDFYRGEDRYECVLVVLRNNTPASALLPGMLASGELTLGIPVEIGPDERLKNFTNEELLAELKRRLGR